MNDMSGCFAGATLPGDGGLRDISARTLRLAPPRAFSEAAAMVEDALKQLRSAEMALERQLGELRNYIRPVAESAAN